MSLRAAAKHYEDYGSISTTSPKETVDSSGSSTPRDESVLEGCTSNNIDVPEHISSDDRGPKPARRQIGVFSAVFIIFNRLIGTGVFATPGFILAHSGSVGLSLIMWVIGAIVAWTGMQVYITWGTALPKNGGEKNYLEYLFRKPKFLVTSMYAANGTLLAFSAGNSLVFGEYMLKAANHDPGRWSLRIVGFGCITFAWLLHGTALKWGLRIQNFLGMFKILVLLIVVGTGFVALSGHMKVEKPHNFENIFEGTTANPSAICISMYSVMWSYAGFSNVNYALSEVKNPARTIRIAGPLAIGVATVLYLLANIAYLAGASKEELTGSGRLVAALLFRNVYGPQTERILSVFVALSALGNVLSVVFAHGRVNQELGREGILPFSKFWGSNRPFNAPLAGLGLHWIVGIIVILALPPGDAYNFIINLTSYPLSIVNTLVPFGIIYLAHWRPYSDWTRVSVAVQASAALFGFANMFLIIAPFIKPPPGGEPYVNLPYWAQPVGGWAVLGVGLVYWFTWARVLPWVGGYRLLRVEKVGSDGLVRRTFRRLPKL